METIWVKSGGKVVLDSSEPLNKALVEWCQDDVATCVKLFAPHGYPDGYPSDWTLPNLDDVDDIARTLHSAIRSYQLDTVALILKTMKYGPWRRIPVHLDSNLLVIAAAYGDVPMFKLLLRHHPQLDVATLPSGWSAFLAAATYGRVDMLRFLGSRPNVDVNISCDGDTAVLLAAGCGSLEAVQLLRTEFNADVSVRDASGCTALHLAVEAIDTEERVPLVEYLLRCPEVDVMAVDNQGCTALHSAASLCTADVVQCLLKDPRMDPTRRALDGRTAQKMIPRHEPETAETKRLFAARCP
jgi:hypothetical protein